MKEKNEKNVSLGAGLAPPSLLEGQEPATGELGVKSWRQNPEEPMPGGEIDGFLPSPPPWRGCSCFGTMFSAIPTMWPRAGEEKHCPHNISTLHLTLLPVDRASSGHIG